MAYTSNESGQFEMYLSPFPATGAKWQVSSGGADTPRWNRNGKELFYLGSDSSITAVSVSLGARVEVGKTQTLFKTSVRRSGGADFMQYDVTADGQRFVLSSLRASNSQRPGWRVRSS